ncbi:uncharacterized protein K02A2.6-like [Saccostrea cucullata]|uniref:uncharacterized protein K02A2.6-like n=1 Tax=Saccostrea cuccullata TaxID=36930 RepID=UPI002ED3B3AA
MAKFAAIGRIDIFDNNVETWNSYSERLDQYFVCNDVKEEKKVPALLSLIGGKTYQLLRGLTAPTKPADVEYAALVKILGDHLNPPPVVISERFRFYKRDQREGESIRDYIADLRRLSEHCAFKDSLNESLRDRLVCGLRSEAIQNKLLAEKDLTLEKATQIAQAMETAFKDATELQSKHVGMVNKLGVRQKKGYHSAGTGVRSPQPNMPKVKRGTNSKKCFRCNSTAHDQSQCYYKDKQCYNCSKIGHCKKACRKTKEVYNVDWSENLIGSLDVNSVEKTHSGAIVVNTNIDGVDVDMELDTGAAVSVMSKKKFCEYFPGRIKNLPESNMCLKTYTGEILKPCGVARVNVSHNNQKKDLDLYVMQKAGPTLFGREWLQQISLDWPSIKSMSCVTDKISDTCSDNVKADLKHMLEKHRSVFQSDIGTVKGIEATLNLKPDAKPKFCKARSVPYALKPKVEAELDKLVRDGIITKVDYSEWATPIVPVIKSDKNVRICGDFKVTLNPVLEIDQYPLPRIEDIFAALAGGKRFTKLDLRHAYLQMRVNEESRNLLTINTEKGLYRYNRLVYGVASAPAIWQRTIDTVLQGLTGVKCIIDDMIITGSSEEEHLKNLEAVLTRLDEYNLRVNLNKCEFFRERVSYCGHEIDCEGLHKTQSKIEAVVSAPKPKNVSELRSFLGIVNYYARFLPNLSSLLYPLHHLLSKSRKWSWSSECDKAFSEVKQLITSDEILTHYDPQREVRLACDASPYGLGCVLSHVMDDGSERPIAYASRSLSSAERNYSQIDREALGIVWGVKRFHTYLYGRHFSLLTDHRPLVSIFSPSKGVSVTTAARMQRYALFLSGYDYDIMYKNTKAHGNADSLSRLPLSDCESDDDYQDIDLMYLPQFETLPITSDRIRQETGRDPVTVKVYGYTMNGWNFSVKADDKELYRYFTRKDELTIHNGCLLWGMRVVVPTKLRDHILKELHLGHIGVVKMKALARSVVWWPGIDLDIERITKACSGCQEFKRAPPAAPIHPWEWPTKPWERIHIDFAGPFMNWMFLVAVDAHSKWPEVIMMRETTSHKTIEVLRSIFARNGVPTVLVSDNGPQFTSDEFGNFIRTNGIKHVTSAPYHPSSNGLAERFVQSFKSAMKSSKKDGGSVETKLSNFLLAYRNAAHSTTGESPAKLFIGRSLQSRLDLIKPDIEQNVKNKQFHIASKRSSSLRVFEPGHSVIVRDYRHSSKSDWVPGTVQEQTGPVSYRVQVGDNTWRRHVDQIYDSSLKNQEVVPSDLEKFVPQVHVPIPTVSAKQSSPEVFPQGTKVRQSTPEVFNRKKANSPIQEQKSQPEVRTEPTILARQNPRRNVGPPKRFSDYVTFK